jgi:hypothetical protein
MTTNMSRLTVRTTMGELAQDVSNLALAFPSASEYVPVSSHVEAPAYQI